MNSEENSDLQREMQPYYKASTFTLWDPEQKN